MNRLDTRLKNFRKNSFKTQKSIFLFGLFFAFAITLKEVTNLSYNNFQIFYFGSTDFWNDINPYSNWLHLSKRNVPLDIFLYLPVFSILFTPFTFLPMWLGAFFWNFFTYSLFYFSIFQLPEKFLFKDKKFIFFISCLLLFATMLSMQFNPVIAAIFLLAFSYFEKDKPYIALLLILLSGFTKVYGIFQLSMLIFYPKFWKNVGFTLIIGILLFFLPLVHLDFSELMGYTILFGLGSELHTYVIAMVGYAIWYLYSEKSKFNTVLLWINFFLLVIFPIDIFCPVVISKFVLGKLNLGVLVFFITWISMVYKTFSSQKVDYTEPKA